MKKKRKPALPKRKRYTREQRLPIARKWLEGYQGKDVIRGYCKWFNVSRLCAVIELKLLNYPLKDGIEEKIRQEEQRRRACNRQKRESQRAQELSEKYSESSTEFAFIAGYTAGGCPYGVSWDEFEETEEFNRAEYLGLLGDGAGRSNLTE